MRTLRIAGAEAHNAALNVTGFRSASASTLALRYAASRPGT